MTGVAPARILRGDIDVRLRARAGPAWWRWQVRDVLLLLYVSALFAVVLRPVVYFTGGCASAVAAFPGLRHPVAAV